VRALQPAAPGDCLVVLCLAAHSDDIQVGAAQRSGRPQEIALAQMRTASARSLVSNKLAIKVNRRFTA